MKGIRLSHGTIFVTDGVWTVRLLRSGECDVSPVLYSVIEWEMSKEPMDKWEYITEYEIKTLPDGGYDKIKAVFDKIYSTVKHK